ncbi:hypothetical protein AB0F46_35320 [Streptomyces sp. NPDC026665]|uniref:zinc finger domain-containing protein n=1 Tax=Streptomyces sp. NPDC026665 TaxID=3154798 RepID=UPI0033E4261D
MLSRRPQRRDVQTVDIPERVYRGAHYSDAFVKAWAKIAALDIDGNVEHCNAHVAEMARFSGLSKRAFERALTEGSTAGPDGGPPEFTTQRMTHSGGRGRTAIREVRSVRSGERHVPVSITMCDALEPRRLRAALLMLHAAKYTPGYTPSSDELAGELFHHHGEHAGETLSERTARRIINDLDDAGWIDVGRRAGHQGRNTVAVRPHPLRPSTPAPARSLDADQAEDAECSAAPTTPGSGVESASADNHGGSGADTGGGSLAIKEYTPAVTDKSAQVVGGSRRRRGDRKYPGTGAGDLGPATFGPGTSRAPRGTHTPRPSTDSSRTPGPYTGPELRWTQRIHDALAPVRHELDGIRRHVLRQIAAAIGKELDANPASSSGRIADRISRRLQPILREDIREMGSWLLAVGLPHKGCGLPSCEDSHVWPTGEPCETCAHAARVQRAQWRQARELQERLDELRARASAGTAALPAKASYRQRDAATDDQVRQAIAEHGPAGALHIYGHLRVGPLLRVEGYQEQLPLPAAAQAPADGPVIPGRMPAAVRAAVRPAVAADSRADCPTCHASPGQPCTTPHGRRRARHEARPTHPATAHPAASGEDS